MLMQAECAETLQSPNHVAMPRKRQRHRPREGILRRGPQRETKHKINLGFRQHDNQLTTTLLPQAIHDFFVGNVAHSGFEAIQELQHVF